LDYGVILYKNHLHLLSFDIAYRMEYRIILGVFFREWEDFYRV
jgi:hypothetical protein